MEVEARPRGAGCGCHAHAHHMCALGTGTARSTATARLSAGSLAAQHTEWLPTTSPDQGCECAPGCGHGRRHQHLPSVRRGGPARAVPGTMWDLRAYQPHPHPHAVHTVRSYHCARLSRFMLTFHTAWAGLLCPLRRPRARPSAGWYSLQMTSVWLPSRTVQP